MNDQEENKAPAQSEPQEEHRTPAENFKKLIQRQSEICTQMIQSKENAPEFMVDEVQDKHERSQRFYQEVD